MWESLDGFSGNGNNWKEEITNNAKKKRFDTNSCRQINQVFQLRANIWRGLVKMNEFSKKLCESDNEDKNAFHRTDRDFLRTSLKKQEEQLKDLIRVEKKCSGPVGNYPIHDCILLGHLNLAKELISEDPTFLDQRYENDFDFWHSLVPKLRRDSGLYTGETVLHLAIGSCSPDSDFVKFVLEQVSAKSKLQEMICSRAVGLFFQPPWVLEEKPSFLRSLLSPTRQPHRANKTSRCYYGEFPLSFASSVGNIEVCGHIRFFLQQDSGSGWHKVLFNQDSNGNTALHMAVIHRQVAVVKWLLDAEEELSDSAKWEHRKSLLVMGISQFSFLDY